MPHTNKPIIAILGSDSISWVDVFRYVDPNWCGEVVGGGENSVDFAVKQWCGNHNIEYISYRPNYKIWGRRYGKQQRDDDILSYIDKLIYFWDNKEEMEIVYKAKNLQIPLMVHVIEER